MAPVRKNESNYIWISIYLIAVIFLFLALVFVNWPDRGVFVDEKEQADSSFLIYSSDSAIGIKGDFSAPLASITEDTLKLSLTVSNNDSSILKASKTMVPQKLPVNEKKLLLLILLMGALGASLHGIASLSKYTGNSSFKNSWTIWYLLRPLVGALLSLIFYLIIRAGLFNQFTPDTNFYTIIALSGLIGLFSKQALDKLSDIFDVIFKSDKGENLSDKINANPTPAIESILPENLSSDSQEKELIINGSDFNKKSLVFINSKEYIPGFKSKDQLTVAIDELDLQNGCTLNISVFNPPPEGGISNVIEKNVGL